MLAHSPHRTTQSGILLVESDATLRTSMAQLLRRSLDDFVAEADGTADVSALHRRLSPSVVVLGLEDPDPEAVEVLRKVRHQSSTAVVLVTPIRGRRWVETVRKLGANALLARPPRECELVAAVELARANAQSSARSHVEVARLRQRIQGEAAVEQAAGILMRRENLTFARALDRLREHSLRTGHSVQEVAEALVLASRVASRTSRPPSNATHQPLPRP